MQDLITRLLVELGEDPSREGLVRTPIRVEKALKFLTSGYRADVDEVLNGALFGIRAMSLDQSPGLSLIILGNSTSESDAPFTLCSWDGNAQGHVREFKEVRFHKRMKVEGVTRGTIQGAVRSYS